MEHLGFWMFLAALAAIDTYVFLRGHNTYLWSYKTDEEKEVQRVRLMGKRRI